jgi:hypothetical protein
MKHFKGIVIYIYNKKRKLSHTYHVNFVQKFGNKIFSTPHFSIDLSVISWRILLLSNPRFGTSFLVITKRRRRSAMLDAFTTVMTFSSSFIVVLRCHVFDRSPSSRVTSATTMATLFFTRINTSSTAWTFSFWHRWCQFFTITTSLSLLHSSCGTAPAGLMKAAHSCRSTEYLDSLQNICVCAMTH